MPVILRKNINWKRVGKVFLISALILLSATSFILGYRYGLQENRQNISFLGKDFSYEDEKLFWQTWKYINEKFVDPSKIDPQKAAFNAAKGLVYSLEDPYSDLLTQSQGEIFEEDLSGSFGGVGIEIGIKKGILTVISPLESTPADKAGLKAGDQIIAVDGEPTENMTLEEAVMKIRGEIGTKVVLTIMRESFEKPKDFEIIRDKIEIPVIKYEFINPDIGYIKINTFISTTLPKFTEAITALVNQGAQKFIIDLRNNPGGYLEVALRMAEIFVPRGKILVIQKTKENESAFRSEGPGVLADSKVVILVNSGSASASEIFAAALRKHLNAKLVGETTFGKGTVQQIFKINGNLLKLTIAYWLTPDGVKIEGNGLKPDIEIKDKTENNRDLIKEKAIDLLK